MLCFMFDSIFCEVKCKGLVFVVVFYSVCFEKYDMKFFDIQFIYFCKGDVNWIQYYKDQMNKYM